MMMMMVMMMMMRMMMSMSMSRRNLGWFWTNPDGQAEMSYIFFFAGHVIPLSELQKIQRGDGSTPMKLHEITIWLGNNHQQTSYDLGSRLGTVWLWHGFDEVLPDKVSPKQKSPDILQTGLFLGGFV